MQVAIHIDLDNLSDIHALLAMFSGYTNGAAVAPAAGSTGAAAAVDNVIRDADDVAEGDLIHWSGLKFTFDGVVASGRKVRHPDADAVLFVRRNDTGRLISLTQDDLDRGGLTRRNG